MRKVLGWFFFLLPLLVVLGIVGYFFPLELAIAIIFAVLVVGSMTLGVELIFGE